jgi:ketosteroid isomerase-like protein
LEFGQVAQSGASLFRISDGRVTRLVLYWDRDRAFTDHGLKE